MSKLTEQERKVICALGHPLYTVDFIENWLTQPAATVGANPVAAMQQMAVEGFMKAVRCLVEKSPNASEADIYPLTVLSDRYNGCYSGGRWTAWNKYPDDIPYGPFGDDTSCMEFWHDEHSFPVGVGETPDEAVRDLKDKMRKER